jgi:hypothetical protein
MTLRLTVPSLRDELATRPWRTLAIATLAGGCLACVPDRGIRRAMTRLVGSFTLVVVREYVVAYAAAHAGAWLETALSPRAPAS